MSGSAGLKICVVTPRFTISGVPLAQLRFARALAEAGHRVDLIIGWAPSDLPVPQVAGVTLTVLGQDKVRGMFWPLVRYLRRSRPDLVFSAEDHLNALVLTAGILARSRAKFSGSSRVTPFDTFSSTPFTKRWLLKQVVRATSWRADAQTCVSKDMVEQYREVFGSPKHVSVYNIVDDAASRARLAEPVDHPWFTDKALPVLVGAGSLFPWKGFGDLIAAVGLLHARGTKVRLMILGEGPLRGALEAQVAALGLGEYIALPGHTANPLKFFAHADAFVLSSHVEGMPNVLVEAMMAGCTPVAADCPTGPRELLAGGRYGYLVAQRDPAALADGIEQALRAPIDPAILAEAVRPFEETTVIARHMALLGLGPAEAEEPAARTAEPGAA